MRNGSVKYGDAELTQAVAESRSAAEALQRLGLCLAGGNYNTLRKKIRLLQLDTSHWSSQAWSRGKLLPRMTPEEVLVVDRLDGRRENIVALRRSLLACGTAEECVACGQGPVWQGSPLRLQVDHKNGDKFDNRIDNLQFLCPNCHSQTPTYGGRNIRRTPA